MSKLANTENLCAKFPGMEWLDKCQLIIVDNIDALRRMVTELLTAGFVTYDVETTGLQIIDDSLVSMQFAGSEDTAYFIPLAMQGMTNLSLPEVIVELQPLWKRGLIGHNIGYDWKMTQRFVDFEIEADTVIEAKLVPELWNDYQYKWDLKSLAHGLFQLEVVEYSDLFPRRTPKKAMRFDLVDPEYGIPYACQDVLLTWKLHLELLAKYKLDQSHNIYKWEHQLIKVIARMELLGIGLNTQKLNEAEKVATALMDTDQATISALAGEDILISSSAQISKLLYEKLGLVAPRMTPSGKTGSSDAKAMEMLKGQHPVIETIVHYRNIEKLRNAFLSKLPGFVQSDGCVHTSYNQYGAISGRMSSKKPNLQQVPKERDKDGDELRVAIRSSFVPPVPYIGLLDIDFSQIEYRLAASLAKDRGLIEAFINGVDVHVKTAAMMYKVPIEEVDKQMRNRGKTANFAAIYGQGPDALAETWGLTRYEAQEIMKQYWRAVPGLRRYCEYLREQAREKGYSETYFGRKRVHPNINHRAYSLKSTAEREAVNSPIQGAAADLMKLAMLRCDKALKVGNFKSGMLLTVHDQLTFGHHPDDDLDTLSEAMREAMELDLPGFVPLLTDAGYGPNWNDIEKFEYPSRRAIKESPAKLLPAPLAVLGTTPALEVQRDYLKLFMAESGESVARQVYNKLSSSPGPTPVVGASGFNFEAGVLVNQTLLFALKALGIKFELGVDTRNQVRQALLSR